MLKNLLLTYLLLGGLFFVVAQQKARVSGVVKTRNGETVPLVLVQIDSTYKTIATLDGLYQFDSIPFGVHILTVNDALGGSFTQKFNLNGDIVIDAQLKEGGFVQDTVEIKYSKYNDFGREKMEDVEGFTLTSGMKTEVVNPNEMVINSSTNNAREGYSKISGVNVWESDNYGIQLGIGVRGLSPNRSANFNVRQNGYDIAADAIGYPESYYTPAFAALDRIEIIRGAASLQFGPQFGGMMNFKFKKGPEEYPVESVVRQTVGSFGYTGTFVSVAGEKNNLNYYSYYNYKQANGWRPNNQFDHHNAFLGLNYKVNERLKVCFEYTFMNYLAQQPGGLTDEQFETDARQSTRSRNWFEVNWNLFALNFDYKLSDRSSLNMRNFGLIASRDALGNLGRISRPDLGENRNLIVDQYQNIGNETRLLTKYTLFGDSARRNDTSAFIVGVRLYKGLTNSQQGIGSAGTDANFDYIIPASPDDYESGSDYEFPNFNFAAFVENQFKLSSKWSITPGVRFEYLSTQGKGRYYTVSKDRAGNFLGADTTYENITNNRSFVLFGLGSSFQLSKVTELYGNVTQNYRPVTFSDIRINNPNKAVDPSITDENGFNADLGMRGTVLEKLFFDITSFYMQYNDRIGSIWEVQGPPTFSNLKVVQNVADAEIYGVEAFLETDLIKLLSSKNRDTKNKLNYFINASWMQALYVNTDDPIIADKQIELVPDLTFRTGATFKYHDRFGVSLLFTYITEQYSDATNSEYDPDAVVGLIPSYTVLDLGVSYELSKIFKLEAGINNLADKRYFTRRADGYPGPGIIPSDARSYYATIQMRLNRDSFKKGAK